MTTPMSDKRLAAINDHCERRTEADAAESWDDMSSDYAVELLEEVERLRAERAEVEQPAMRKPVDIGTGMPATSHLEAFGQALRDAFGAMPYHVGSSIHGKQWRDVDVRLMLDDDRFDALFPGYANYRQGDAWWALVCSAISELGRQRTGLPIDFQIQRTSEANEKFPGARNPLFVGHAAEDHRPTMICPQRPDPEPCDGDCDCDCQPSQPCLCPERDCYCGPCRVCGENPAQPDPTGGAR